MNIFRILSLTILLLVSHPLIGIEDPKTILVVGDSLSAGYGIETKQGWVSLLSDRIQKLNLKYQVINISVSGDTTSNGVDSLLDALKQYHPAIIIIGLGSNDGLRGLSTIEMQKNLNRMVQLAKGAKAKVLLVGFLIPINYGPVYRKKFEDVFKTVADTYKLPRVPFLLQEVALNPKLMQEDGLHPTAEAQPLILETVWTYLAKLL